MESDNSLIGRGYSHPLVERYSEKRMRQDAELDDAEGLLKVIDGKPFTLTEDMVVDAAAAEWTASKWMEMLLDLRGEEVNITEDVLKEVAGNWLEGHQTLDILLERRPQQVIITDAVIGTAADLDMFKRLIVLRGEDFARDGFPLEIIRALCVTDTGSAEMIKYVFEHYGNDIKIPEDYLLLNTRTAYNSQRVFPLLFDHRAPGIELTEEMLLGLASRSDATSIPELFRRHRDKLKVTDELVLRVARNFDKGVELMQFLLRERSDETRITEEVLLAVSANSLSTDMTALLLEERGEEIVVSEQFIRALVRSLWRCRETLDVVLVHRHKDKELVSMIIRVVGELEQEHYLPQIQQTYGFDISVGLRQSWLKRHARNETVEAVQALLD